MQGMENVKNVDCSFLTPQTALPSSTIKKIIHLLEVIYFMALFQPEFINVFFIVFLINKIVGIFHPILFFFWEFYWFGINS